jgi:hypothetical protein
MSENRMPFAPHLAAPSSRSLIFWISAAILVAAMVFGGSAQGREMLFPPLQLSALTLLPIVCWRLSHGRIQGMTWGLIGLACLIMGIVLIQLVPLSPALWTALPGRDLALQTLEVAGVAVGPHPLSLDPQRTWDSFLWLWPPVSIALAAASLDSQARIWLMALVIGLMIAGMVLGALQVTSLFGSFLRVAPEVHSGLPIGFFANRNHQAVALAAALPFVGALASRWGEQTGQRLALTPWLFIALSGLFVVGILATRSRAGLVLGGVALVLSLASFLRDQHDAGRGWSRRSWMVLGVACVSILAVQVGAGAVLNRFDRLESSESRFQTWPIILQQALKFQPAGSGIGAFEAILLCTPRDFTAEERTFLQRGAEFLMARELRLGSSTRHNASERVSAEAWDKLCFPRFYFYDVLRGLRALSLWAEVTKSTVPASAIREVLAQLDAAFADGTVRIGRQGYEGTTKTRLPQPPGLPSLRGDVTLFPLLERVSTVGAASPFLSAQWAETRSRLERLGLGP